EDIRITGGLNCCLVKLNRQPRARVLVLWSKPREARSIHWLNPDCELSTKREASKQWLKLSTAGWWWRVVPPSPATVAAASPAALLHFADLWRVDLTSIAGRQSPGPV